MLLLKTALVGVIPQWQASGISLLPPFLFSFFYLSYSKQSISCHVYSWLVKLKYLFLSTMHLWQVIVCGVLLVVMAVGNFVNTVQTLISKFRFKAKVKKTKARHDLQPDSKSP